eukprot:TRINITY_DN6270_c0_g1_i1.p1 TRINITY_DN6270_c0_g1~~TRINITY_DN6270_c0_g1_i1.p1  ORF type:complete len:589 (-),score=128.57 TRINITY_DN6270_c0_g1_i1:1855-3579(-)
MTENDSRVRILVTDEVDPAGVRILREVPSFNVEVVDTLPPTELIQRICHYDAIIGRSATRISGELLKAGTPRLKVVGRAGVGVDNVNMQVATSLGIAVINAPAGNTVSVAELFFGAIISLVRHLPAAHESMHAGRWDRSKFLGSEIRGKTLGIVGLGRIGAEVATRAAAFGMRVCAFDPYVLPERFGRLGVERMPSLLDLCAHADFLTVHTPLTDETRRLIGAREISALPRTARVLNMARGGIVDDAALVAALREGRLAGACLDVFESEPLKGEHMFRGVPNLFLTPHIGASTVEGQRNVAVDVAEAVRDFFLHGDLSRSLNASVAVEGVSNAGAAIDMATRAAQLGRALLRDHGPIGRVTVAAGSAFADLREALVAGAAAGILSGVVDDSRPVNVINASALATERGITLSAVPTAGGNPSSVEVAVQASDGATMTVGATIPSDPQHPPRLTHIGQFDCDLLPVGTMIILHNRDVPGVIADVAVVVARRNVNIAGWHTGRAGKGGGLALSVLSVDGPVPEAVASELGGVRHVSSVLVVDFPPNAPGARPSTEDATRSHTPTGGGDPSAVPVPAP